MRLFSKHMKILLVIDSFKGTLESATIADVLTQILRQRIPFCDIQSRPIADGGEGLVDCFRHLLHGQEQTCDVTGPLGKKITAKYLLCQESAVLEMAQAAGLPQCDPLSPMTATTYGVGEMLLDAQKKGAKRFYLGLGGSATTDGGCGMAACLGTRFYDENGLDFVPTGQTLQNIARIDAGKQWDVIGLCDVRNPLFGPSGAAYVYAPQKGATPEQVRRLDQGLQHLSTLGDAALATKQGAGAAGGMGYGICRFLGGRLRRGIDAVLDAMQFDDLANDVDWIITGEGCLDSQSVQGKVIDGILARKGKARVLALVGKNKLPDYASYGIQAVFETSRYLDGESIYTAAMRTLQRTAQDVADYLAEQA